MPRNRLVRKRTSFRPEVQGLRFLAVSLVILYHLWGKGAISGGVDVFLFISIFFLTGRFVRLFYEGEKIAIHSQILKTFKRLLPSATVTIIVVLLAASFILPKNYGVTLASQGWASLLYWQNWLLAFTSVDYYAPDHATASPLQHFWSMSVQGQIFVLWPVLLVGCAYLCRRYRLSYRAVLCSLFASIFIISLWFSITSTIDNPAFAYFDTRTRLWEFAFGSLVAIVAPFVYLPEKLKKPAIWASIIAFLLYGLMHNLTTAFPGFSALWPLSAATLFMLSATEKYPSRIASFFGSKHMVSLGNLSYGLYLWHWPLLVLYLGYVQKDSVNIVEALGLIVLSFTAAFVNYHYIEQPARRFSLEQIHFTPTFRHKNMTQQSAAVVISLCVLTGAVPLTFSGISSKERQAESIRLAQTALGEYPYFGAKTFNENLNSELFSPNTNNPRSPNDKLQLNNTDESFLPFPENFGNEWVELPLSCEGFFTSLESDEARQAINDTCRTLTSDKEANKLIVVLGDSHAQQWLQPLIPLAQKNNWQIVSFLKGACPYANYDAVLENFDAYSEQSGTAMNAEEKLKHATDCRDYYNIVESQLNELSPDLIYTIGTKSLPDAPGEILPMGFTEAAKAWEEKSVPLLSLRDNPRFNFNIAECALSSPDPNTCAVPREFRTPTISPLDTLEPHSNVIPLDLTDFLCDENYCYAAAGNVLIYLDDNHISKDYAASIAPFFEARFLNATGWNLEKAEAKNVYRF